MSLRDGLREFLSSEAARRFWRRMRPALAVVILGGVGVLLMPKGDPNNPAEITAALQAQREEAFRVAMQSALCFSVDDPEIQEVACDPNARVTVEDSMGYARQEVERQLAPEPQPVLFAQATAATEAPPEPDTSQVRVLEAEIARLNRDLAARESRLMQVEDAYEDSEAENARLRQRVATAVNATNETCDAAVNQAVNETVRAMERENVLESASQVCFTTAQWASERGRLDGLCSTAGFVRDR